MKCEKWARKEYLHPVEMTYKTMKVVKDKWHFIIFGLMILEVLNTKLFFALFVHLSEFMEQMYNKKIVGDLKNIVNNLLNLELNSLIF